MMRALDKGIEITVGEKPKKIFGIFGSNDQQKKLIVVPQKAKRDHLHGIMERLKANEE